MKTVKIVYWQESDGMWLGHIDAVLPDQAKAAVKKVLGGKLGKDNILCIDGGNGLWRFVNGEKIPFKLSLSGKHVHEKGPIFLARTKKPFFPNRNLAGRGVLIRCFRMDATSRYLHAPPVAE
jgi:hypothetical protein